LHAQSAKMQPVATDVAWSVCVYLSVCLLDTVMSCSSEMAEPIQILDAVWGVHSGEPKELCIR